MRKIASYIALGLALFIFIYTFITTGSFVTAIAFAGIFFVWFIIENLVEFIMPFGRKSDNRIRNDINKKQKKELHKKTENNPTLR